MHPDSLSRKRSEIRKCSRLKKGLELQKKGKGYLLCGNTLDSAERRDTQTQQVLLNACCYRKATGGPALISTKKFIQV